MEMAVGFVKKLLPYAASPVLALVLLALVNFVVKPIVTWDFPIWIPVLVAALLGTAFATFLPRGRPNARTKTIALVVPVVAFFALLLLYNFVSDQPPYVGWVWFWEGECFITYFGSYLALGYFLAFAGRVLVDKRWLGKPTPKKEEEEGKGE